MLEAHELEEGRDYFILLTTSGGLYRYDIHDVVRCVGFQGQAPLLEFLNKGKNFSNLTGEKLSEHQVIRAVEKSFRELHLPIDIFHARARHGGAAALRAAGRTRTRTSGRAAELAARVQANLEQLNEEYAAKCASGRLLPVAGSRSAARNLERACGDERPRARGNFEEYKHPCLVRRS